jgi:hypothetical protein
VSRLACVLRSVCALFALLPAGHAALAGGDRRGPAAPLLATYQQECSACHVAFPPRMLPSDAWRRLLGNLPRHYGTDASLDAATVEELAAWLSANAGTDRRVREAPREDRITNSAWFIRKHDDVPAAVWQSPAVNSAANCSACHAQAAQGDFNEHRVRIPR